MATKARQQYFADEDSLQKIRREFSIADEIQQKIDSIEPGAQVNKIETVKVNGTALVPDANKAVNVEVPEVIDNLYTVDSDNALSAKQGKLLYDYIQNIASRGRFLSNWNSATGLPMTNPSENPYPYKSGDYFVVSNVATSGGTNYRPDGSSYIIGQASTVVETNSVDVSDFYFYDGTNWLLLSNSGRSGAVDSALSTTSTNPVENRVITNALNNKQDTLTAGTGINITSNTISTKWIEVNVATAYGGTTKVGTTTAGNYTPTKGDFLLVNFVNGCSVDSPTLNIDGSGAKNIKTGSANANKSTFALGTTANSNIKALLYYDGTYYRCWSTSDTNTTYSAMSVSEGQTGTATSQRTMRADYLKQIIKYHAVDNSRLSDDWYSGTAIAPSQASIYYEFAKRDIQAGTDLEIVGISSHNLPAGYTELSFLGGSGSGYINTGNILQCKDTFKIKFKRPTATAPSGTLSFFGSLQGSNSIPRSNVGFRTNGYLFGGVNQTIDFASIDTNIHTIEIGYDGVSYYYKYDNGAKKTYTLTSAANPSINAYLFARNSSPIVYSGGIRIYYLEWHREDGTEVAHLIPAQRNSDGVLGMYDLVSDTFLAPAGSGTWSGEPESLGNVINFTNDSGYITSADVPTKTSDLTNDSGFITSAALPTRTSDLTNDSGFLTSSTGVTSVNGNHGAVTVNEPIVSATAPSSPTEGMIWYDTTNDQLKVYDGTNWVEVGKEYHAGEGISIGTVQDYSAMRGPCPEGFHVPLNTEWQAVYNVWTTLGGGSSDGINFGIALKLPFAGIRADTSAVVRNQGYHGSYWSSSRANYYANYLLHFVSDGITPQDIEDRAEGCSVRCFKDVPIVPTDSWTKLYGTSIESGGIFWSSSDGLISLSGDGSNWITIADKNLGATTVWNSGDTLSETNCGGYFQWGNNYMFPFTGNVTTSSTQVDASNYGPGNYYSSNTFITYNGSWDSSDNRNLRGGVTGVVTLDNVISNTGVLSVNGQTGHIEIDESNTKTFFLNREATQAEKIATLQEVYDWIKDGTRNAIIEAIDEEAGNLYPDKTFILSNIEVSEASGNPTVYDFQNGFVSDFTQPTLRFYVLNNTVTNYGYDYNRKIARAGNGINITGDRIINTLPGPTIAATAPTGTEGALWYDTTNDVLKVYNGSQWNEIGGDVKVFSLPSVNDDITDILDQLTLGKGVIFHETASLTSQFYKVDSFDDVNNEIVASVMYPYGDYVRSYTINYNYGTKMVVSINRKLSNFFAPETAGTQGQVLTKTNSGYEWANASGGDVMVSSQPNNILTSGMKIWAGEETDYSNLGTYDTNTVYLTIPDGSVQAIDNNENLPNDAD